ncbi:hypothetical protein BS50DRAFT_627835 [Corynespora cassiicola Philippines]|uniref:Uncharacterized protein n=1 Tax=Corynespora cassiicola Philippines TaxID=1448308 RepID=A0A2T2PA54_CORCC|nr:hypothetical protein BS50DRAFT_627835 [Corynespora cassiicola Philippines]
MQISAESNDISMTWMVIAKPDIVTVAYYLQCGESCQNASARRKQTIVAQSWPGPILSSSSHPICDIFYIKHKREHSLREYHSHVPISSVYLLKTAANPQIQAHPKHLYRLPKRLKLFPYIFAFIVFSLHTPFASPLPLIQHPRQAIPDSSGNTGSTLSKRPPTNTTTPTFTLPPIPPPSSTPLLIPTPSPPTPPSPPSIPDSTSPLTPLAPLPAPTNTTPSLPAPAIAGISLGATLLLALLAVLGVFAHRRRRHKRSVREIPIRRSKLGSRLRMRVCGEEGAGEAKREEGSLENGKAVRGLKGMLAVPRLVLLPFRREGVGVGEKGVWVNKAWISEPRPGRPASAEPLGRLSGMGMGMGYLN